MDKCADDRQFTEEFTPRFYQILYESLIWIITRSCKSLTKSSQQDKPNKSLQEILSEIVKKNRKDAHFITRAKQVNLALRKLGLGKNSLDEYSQQKGQRSLLMKVLDIYHEACKNQAVALIRSKQ